MEHLNLDKNLRLEGTADLAGAEYTLLGAPLDASQTHRTGSREGPLAIRRQLLELEKTTLFEKKFCDAGNLEVIPGTVKENLKRLEEVARDILGVNEAAKPVTLGGEHTVSYPIIKALDAVEPVHVVWLDAHADLKDDYVGQKWCHATVARRIRELGVELTQAGVRSQGSEEVEYAGREGIPQSSLEELKSVEGGRVYVSVDLDVLDSAAAPGVGNPEPGGVSFNSLKEVINSLASANEVAGFDVVELTPAYDAGGASAAAAAKLALEFMEH